MPGKRFLADNPYLLAALASLMWSGNHVTGRAIAGHVPPYAISTIRWLLPTLALLLFAREIIRRDWPVIRAHWPVLLMLGLTGGTVFTVLQYVGLQYTTALNVSVLNSLTPVFMVATAAVLFADFMAPRQMFGLVVSLIGVLVIITRGDPQALAHLNFNIGDLIIVFNMAVSAVYSVCLRLRPQMHWLSFMFVLAVISCVTTTPLWIYEAAGGYTLQFDTVTVLACLYVAVFPGFLATAAWNRSIDIIGSNRAGPFLHVIPLYSAIMATAFLGETLGVFHVAGLALILSGVWLASRKA